MKQPASPTSSKADVTLSNISVALAIAKDVGESLEKVPYVKSVTGVLVQILKIREDILFLNEFCDELILHVAARSVDVLRSFQALATDNVDGLEGLRSDMEEYASLLARIHAQLQQLTMKRGKISYMFRRGDIKNKLERFTRDIKEFDARFIAKHLTALRVDVRHIRHTQMQQNEDHIAVSDSEIMFQESLPPPPAPFVGREDELESLVKITQDHDNPHIAILGTAGLGKTTLATTLLNRPLVRSKFPQTFFVSCEEVASYVALLNAIANVLQLEKDARGPKLQSNIVAALKERHTLLCLDNFEDPWNRPALRSQITSLLTLLDGIPHLGVIVTMRGIERPRGLTWTRPYPSPLSTLSSESAIELFQTISSCTIDERDRVAALVSSVDNVPIAVELLAHQVEMDGLDDVMQRWEKEGLSLLDRGGGYDTRLTSVTASIQLSLTSPQVIGCPDTVEVLGAVSQLPDGLAVWMVQVIEMTMPVGICLDKSLRTLVRAALIHKDHRQRYRVLAPIRQHLLSTVNVDEGIQTAFWGGFIALIHTADLPDGHPIVAPEMPNLKTVLSLVYHSLTRIHSAAAAVPSCALCKVAQVPPEVARNARKEWLLACAKFIHWQEFIGTYDVSLAELALSHADDPSMELQLHLTLGLILRWTGQLRLAEMHLQSARQLGEDDPKMLIQVLNALGDLYRMMNRYREAERVLTTSHAVATQHSLHFGYVFTLIVIGATYHALERFEDAEDAFLKAKTLSLESSNRAAEGNSLGPLGSLYVDWKRYADAEECLKQAIEIAHEVKNVAGEAHALRKLGDLHMRMARFEEGEDAIRNALDIYVKTQMTLNQGHAMWSLGIMHTLQKVWEEAEKAFRAALSLHEKADDGNWQGNDWFGLGNLAFHRQDYATAVKFTTTALKYHEEASQANSAMKDHIQLAQGYLALYRREDAMKHILLALSYKGRVHISRSIQFATVVHLLHGLS